MIDLNNNPHSGHRDRVRNKVMDHGYDFLNDHELLELLLFNVFPQKDTNGLAHKLIESFGSLKGVLEASPLEIKSVEGFGETSAAFVGALMPVIRRYLMAISNNQNTIKNVKDAKTYAKSLCVGMKVECAYAIYLNKRNRIICTTKLSEGTVDETAVYHEKITHEAMLHQAYYVIIVHNHPSGRVTPSYNDEITTYSVMTSLSNFKMILLDSIIVSDLEAYSMYECDQLNSLKDSPAFRELPPESQNAYTLVADDEVGENEYF